MSSRSRYDGLQAAWRPIAIDREGLSQSRCSVMNNADSHGRFVPPILSWLVRPQNNVDLFELIDREFPVLCFDVAQKLIDVFCSRDHRADLRLSEEPSLSQLVHTAASCFGPAG